MFIINMQFLNVNYFKVPALIAILINCHWFLINNYQKFEITNTISLHLNYPFRFNYIFLYDVYDFIALNSVCNPCQKMSVNSPPVSISNIEIFYADFMSFFYKIGLSIWAASSIFCLIDCRRCILNSA